MEHFSIFGADTNKEISIPIIAKDDLVDYENIHYDGKSWKFFEMDEAVILERVNVYDGDDLKDKLKAVVIDDTVITCKMLEDIKQMDGDVFTALIEYLYPVKAEYQEDETIKLSSTTEGMAIGDIF